MSLTQKSILAAFWCGADVFLRQGLQFFVSILLARLLTPEDFGVIAMLYVFISLAAVFVDSGFSSALIQCQDTTNTDESTVFFFNLGMGVIVAITLCLVAPWMAFFFELPILQHLTYVMALNLFIGAFGAIHTALLTKALNLKIIMKAGVGATLSSGLLAIVMAWRGFGVWSLVWQTLISSLITVVLLWCWHPWRPQWVFNYHSLHRLFRFGGFMLVSALLDTLYTRLYAVLIGKLFSSKELGYYTRAENTQQLPANLLANVFSRVAFPVFSAAALEPDKLAMGLKKSLLMITMLNLPVMLGLAVVAEPLVITLFGVNWLPSVPFLQVLCLAGMLWPLHVINLNALMALGRSDLFFRIEIIKKCLAVPVLVLASLHSMMAIAWIQVFLGMVAFFINSYFSGVLLGYGPWRQLRDILPFGLVATVMALIVWLVGQLLHWLPATEWFVPSLLWSPAAECVAPSQHWPPVATLATLSVLGCAIYLIFCRLLRLAAFDDLFAIIGRLNTLLR